MTANFERLVPYAPRAETAKGVCNFAPMIPLQAIKLGCRGHKVRLGAGESEVGRETYMEMRKDPSKTARTDSHHVKPMATKEETCGRTAVRSARRRLRSVARSRSPGTKIQR